MRKPAVLVVREVDKFSKLLAENEFDVFNFPLIQTLPSEDLSDLESKWSEFEKYDGLFFTSPKAAEIFLAKFDDFAEIGFAGKVYVLGGRTRALFENTGFLKVVFRENADTAEEFINSFDKKEFAGKKFLFVSGDKSLRVIPELLKNTALVDETIVYRTIESLPDENSRVEIGEKIRRRQIGWICFFSPSAVKSFVRLFSDISLDGVKIAALGATTAAEAAKRKLRVDFISPKARAEDFALGLVKRIKEIE